MKEADGIPPFYEPIRRSGAVLVAHVPPGTLLDPKVAQMFSEERDRLNRPLTIEESKEVLENRAALN